MTSLCAGETRFAALLKSMKVLENIIYTTVGKMQHWKANSSPHETKTYSMLRPDYYNIMIYCITGKSCASAKLESPFRSQLCDDGNIILLSQRGWECRNTFSAHSVLEHDNNIRIYIGIHIMYNIDTHWLIGDLSDKL